VVFLIGMRVNRWWQVPIVFGVAAAMVRMLRELTRDPDSGLLGYENYGGRTTLTLQYWRSLDDLLRYAHRDQNAHMPAWRKWIARWGSTRAVGIWHETYVVEPGTYECVYNHMPPFGLGKVGPLLPAEGALQSSRGRLAAGQKLGTSVDAVAV